MTDEKVAEIHDKIFVHLLEWNRSCPKDELNPYFYIRTRNDDRFNKGYWFPGDSKYLVLSFWAGGDSLNKTQNIYLNVSYEKGIAIMLTGRDSEYKTAYFKQLANSLGDFRLEREDGLWSKFFSPFNENYLQTIDTFIKNEKNIIDNYLQTTIDQNNISKRLIEDIDEYSSAFGFIDPKVFDKHSSRVLQFKAARHRKEQINAILTDPIPKDDTTNLTNSLPIAIESVDILDFRGVEATGRVDLSTTANWIFITGENGYGKSSFLQALALGITNYTENKQYLQTGKVGAYYIKDDQINFVSTYSRDDEASLLNNYFIGYGPIRLIAQPESTENEDGVNSTNIYNLFYPTGLLKNLKFLLTKSKLISDAEFNKIKEALIVVLDKRIVDVKFDPAKIDFTFTERLENGDIIEGMTYTELASGFKNTLNLVGDIITRFSRSQPNIPFNEFIGVIIIDEIENHLHPKMQKELPGLLSKVFPKIQFIVSTHSPIPLLGAPKDSVFLRVERSKEEGITIRRLEQLEKQIKNLLPNTLFTSDLFDLEDIDSVQNDSFDDISLEDSYDDIDKKQEIEKVLKKFEDSEENFPSDLFKKP